MKSSKNSVDLESNDVKEERDSNDESEDESEVLEESPCGRWQKRREQVGPCFGLNNWCCGHIA